MTVIVNGHLVHYQRKGEGPVILLLHGWGDSLTTFDQLVNELSKKYTTLTVDLPGFGGSDPPPETYNLGKYAEFVADFLKKLDLTHIHALIGHSNGGAIAIRGLASGVLQANKLVLLASSGVRSAYHGRKKAFRLAAKTLKLPTKLLPKSTQDKLKKKVYHAVGSDMFVAEHLQDTFKEIVSEDVVYEAAMLPMPTLLIYGTHDQATPLEYGRQFQQQIEYSSLVIIEGADHFLHQTHHTEVLHYVRTFLEQA